MKISHTILKRIHYVSGLIISTFAALHLYNHVCGILGADKHIEIMNSLRVVYRNIFFETILLIAVTVQILSGLTFFIAKKRTTTSGFDKLQLWSGLYLAIFFIIHVGAVFVGRFLHLDTNFFFGVAGLNTFPVNLFFIPYYALAIISFFGHIACIHNTRMKRTVLGLTPDQQSKTILLLGVCLTLVIFYGLTNRFKGVEIPEQYKILISK